MLFIALLLSGMIVRSFYKAFPLKTDVVGHTLCSVCFNFSIPVIAHISSQNHLPSPASDIYGRPFKHKLKSSSSYPVT